MSTPDNSPLDDLIRTAYRPADAGFPPPSLSDMRARKLVARQKEPDADDLFSLVASFLNMKIKLYHAVVAFLIIWAAILLYGGDDTVKSTEAASVPMATNVTAAAYNSTVPACIKTYAIKK